MKKTLKSHYTVGSDFFKNGGTTEKNTAIYHKPKQHSVTDL